LAARKGHIEVVIYKLKDFDTSTYFNILWFTPYVLSLLEVTQV
jgi:hypothetical protein